LGGIYSLNSLGEFMKTTPQNTDRQAAAPVLLRKSEAMERYGISMRFLDQLIAEGQVPTRKLGRRFLRIPVAEADRFFLGKEAVK
jgi:predicted DNA-binding transcriptional regulator AlpA